MKKLCDLVEIAINNEECVVLKVKDNMRMELIALGCFDGDEEMLRITKGDKHTATIFRENSHYSWHWGGGGHTIVTDKIRKCGILIQGCVEDFGIYIGSKKSKIQETLHIKTLEDKRGMQHSLKILYWSGQENRQCNIHKDNEHFRWFSNAREARDYISNNYIIQRTELTTAGTGCKVEEYMVTSK